MGCILGMKGNDMCSTSRACHSLALPCRGSNPVPSSSSSPVCLTCTKGHPHSS
jgi:hypothetical protein